MAASTQKAPRGIHLPGKRPLKEVGVVHTNHYRPVDTDKKDCVPSEVLSICNKPNPPSVGMGCLEEKFSCMTQLLAMKCQRNLRDSVRKGSDHWQLN